MDYYHESGRYKLTSESDNANFMITEEELHKFLNFNNTTFKALYSDEELLVWKLKNL